MRGTGAISHRKRATEDEEDESDEDIKQFKAEQAAGGGEETSTGSALAVPVVPIVKHQEFVYGGLWARTKSAATLTADTQTEACHATTVLHLPDGQVLMAWFGGTYEGAEDVGIWMAKRDKNGWDAPYLATKVRTFISCPDVIRGKPKTLVWRWNWTNLLGRISTDESMSHSLSFSHLPHLRRLIG
jgi:hypothetical protein